MHPRKGTSIWLTLQLDRITDFCFVWGRCSLKHEKLARGKAGTHSVGLLGSMCQLTPSNLLIVSFTSVIIFFPFQIFKYANKERGEGFSNSPFILAKYHKTVREDYMKSTSLEVIEHRVHVTYLTQYINKIQWAATICSNLFTAKLLAVNKYLHTFASCWILLI